MLTLTCPCCGITADETELHPGGEAHLKRVGPGSSAEAFETYLFARSNPKGVHFERWRHAYGCGKWFLAARCTATLEVFGTYLAQNAAPPPEILAAIRARRPDWTPTAIAPRDPEPAERPNE
ncbi:sarcosine oxidase subunit delta [Paracoccus ravus]|uniref:sarcosine oxidase subunit delta n=1 Tax=Paracoccus ravus TaxID=2447760 RepID=UPI00106E7592|nr:sarcosine oxidase subunit delta [Paracoccus ravus]